MPTSAYSQSKTSLSLLLRFSLNVCIRTRGLTLETADAMARAISDYTKSNIGIGITGKLNRVDPNNLVGKDNIVFISIYNRDRDESIHSMVSAALSSREENKDIMIEQIIDIMEEKVI